jgi:hypothetical protein
MRTLANSARIRELVADHPDLAAIVERCHQRRILARAAVGWSASKRSRSRMASCSRTVDPIAELLYGWCAQQMEDAMCYAKDYRLVDDLKKAEDTQVVQERRAGLIARLLNVANKHGEKAKADKTPVKEVAPAK